jgi:hypothetical protein
MSGLPATVTSARTCSSPGVSISSASAAAGSSPKVSGRPRTRLRKRPRRTPRPAPARPRGVPLARGREGEHGSALAVEVAGQDVQDFDQPARERPELLGAGADAGIDRRPLGGRELTGHAADVHRRDATCSGHGLRREAADEQPHLVEALAQIREPARSVQGLLHERARQGSQQEGVRARPDEVMLVGLLGRAGAAGVDHDHLAAPLADAAQPSAHVRRGEQAAVRDERVGAQQEQVLAAVHIRHRDGQHRAEHEPGGHLFRHLVHRARGVDVPAAQHPQPHRAVDHRRQVVGVRVAHVHGHRIATVLLQDRPHATIDLLESLVPARLLERPVATDQRRPQAVRVLVQLLDPVGLRADEAAAEDVGAVAADRHHVMAVRLDLEPARGLAERAGAVLDGHGKSA